jgi:RNA polymerase sigma factor (sigma-70 family)
VLDSALNAGDRAAHDELLRWHREDAYRVPYHYLRDVTLAEDVCQDVVVEAWRLLATVTGKVEALRFWLVRILVDKCRDLADRERVRARQPLQRWATR